MQNPVSAKITAVDGYNKLGSGSGYYYVFQIGNISFQIHTLPRPDYFDRGSKFSSRLLKFSHQIQWLQNEINSIQFANDKI